MVAMPVTRWAAVAGRHSNVLRVPLSLFIGLRPSLGIGVSSATMPTSPIHQDGHGDTRRNAPCLAARRNVGRTLVTLAFLGSFARRARMDRQRMNSVAEFIGQDFVNHPMTCDPGLAEKGFCYDIHSVMGLPSRAVSRMALVLFRFIQNFQAVRRKRLRQFLDDDIFCLHAG